MKLGTAWVRNPPCEGVLCVTQKNVLYQYVLGKKIVYINIIEGIFITLGVIYLVPGTYSSIRYNTQSFDKIPIFSISQLNCIFHFP